MKYERAAGRVGGEPTLMESDRRFSRSVKLRRNDHRFTIFRVFLCSQTFPKANDDRFY